MVTNLLSNFLKFMPAGDRLVVWLMAVQGIEHPSFADDGIGIPEGWLPRLFERSALAQRALGAGKITAA